MTPSRFREPHEHRTLPQGPLTPRLARGRGDSRAPRGGGQCANPALLFSGGKDSICLLRLAEKAFRPARFPFPLLHIDTGHNYSEVIAFRDRRASELGERLLVRKVEDSIREGKVVLAHPLEGRNKHQSVTLLDAIAEHGFDACIGGARRDEEKARAKEARVLVSQRVRPVGPEEPAPRAVEPLQRTHSSGREHPRLPHLELDRARRVAVHRARATRAPLAVLRARTSPWFAGAGRWCR